MQNFERYFKAIAYIEGLANIQSGPNYMVDRKRGDTKSDQSVYIKRIKWFLDLLGNPERDFKYIHITGTAGKGTTSTMVHNGIVKSGQKSGVFTSPFVTTSIEKIQVNDLYISPDEFAGIVEEIKPKIDEAFARCPYGGPSYFERFLAIAFLYFKRQKCTWVVLEVGCGGRYDATNVIPAPVVSAITNIDYDHTHILGKTLTKIAKDKAGIIKKGSKFFTTETRSRLREIMKNIANTEGAEYAYVEGGNKELAEAILREIGISIEVEYPNLPARFELVQKKPMVILDGAHNRAKMKHTSKSLAKIKYDKLHLIFALAENKDLSILDDLLVKSDFIYPTRYQNPERRAMNPKVFAKGKKIFTDSEQALNSALDSAGDKDLILVTGSFYLAGELRKNWYPEEEVLKNRKSIVE